MDNEPAYVQLSPTHQEVVARTGIKLVPLSSGAVADDISYDLVERYARTTVMTDEQATQGNPDKMLNPVSNQANTQPASQQPVTQQPDSSENTSVDLSTQARIAQLEYENGLLKQASQQPQQATSQIVPAGYQHPAILPAIPHIGAMTQLGAMPQAQQPARKFTDFIDMKFVMLALSILTFGSVVLAFVSVTGPNRREDNYSQMMQEQSLASMQAVQEASKKPNICVSFNCAGAGSGSSSSEPVQNTSLAASPGNSASQFVNSWKAQYPDATVRQMIAWQQQNRDPSLPSGDALAQAYNGSF